MHENYGPDFEVKHSCIDIDPVNEPSNQTEGLRSANHDFEGCEMQIFCNARHKTLCHDLKRCVAQYRQCKIPVSTTNIVNLLLESWQQKAIDDGSTVDVTIQLSSERLDIVAHRYLYYVKGGCVNGKDSL